MRIIQAKSSKSAIKIGDEIISDAVPVNALLAGDGAGILLIADEADDSGTPPQYIALTQGDLDKLLTILPAAAEIFSDIVKALGGIVASNVGGPVAPTLAASLAPIEPKISKLNEDLKQLKNTLV